MRTGPSAPVDSSVCWFLCGAEVGILPCIFHNGDVHLAFTNRDALADGKAASALPRLAKSYDVA